MTQVRKALIVAMAQNRAIGRDNKLPWYLPNDLKYFKKVTMGKPIIMGRLTYESIGKPLPGRTNIVVTRNSDWRADGVKVTHSLRQAYDMAQSIAELEGKNEVMVIGGDQIYQQASELADRLYITQVHAEIEGDAYFPELDWSAWQEVGREDFSAEGPNPYDYSFVVYDRK